MNDSTINIYKASYNGNPPPTTLLDLKATDLAIDVDTNILWEYTGTTWVRKAFLLGGEIYLGAGSSIYDMIHAGGTHAPVWMSLYDGDDYEVPSNLRASKSSIAINHKMSNPPLITASYLDPSDGLWYNITPRQGSIISTNDGWSVWVNYLDLVAGCQSIISIFDICSQNTKETRAERSLRSGTTPDSPGGSEGTSVKYTINGIEAVNGNFVVTADSIGAAAKQHAHTVDDIDGLQEALGDYFDVKYTINGEHAVDGNFVITADSINAANPEHTHKILDINGLSDSLLDKALKSHTHDFFTGVKVEGTTISPGSSKTLALVGSDHVELIADSRNSSITISAIPFTYGNVESIEDSSPHNPRPIRVFYGTQDEWDAYDKQSDCRYIVLIHE